MGAVVYLVLTDCPLMVLGAYWRAEPAHTHARTVTGASVVAVMVLEKLPGDVIELLLEDFDDAETPVDE